MKKDQEIVSSLVNKVVKLFAIIFAYATYSTLPEFKKRPDYRLDNRKYYLTGIAALLALSGERRPGREMIEMKKNIKGVLCR